MREPASMAYGEGGAIAIEHGARVTSQQAYDAHRNAAARRCPPVHAARLLMPRVRRRKYHATTVRLRHMRYRDDICCW